MRSKVNDVKTLNSVNFNFLKVEDQTLIWIFFLNKKPANFTYIAIISIPFKRISNYHTVVTPVTTTTTTDLKKNF